jgi:hypothetical protein
MTRQTPDQVRYRNHLYAIAAIDGRGLFDPEEHGIRSEWPGTACWRGYVARYEVSRGRLLLREIEIGRGDQVDPPALFGVAAVTAGRKARYPGSLLYTRMAGPIEYTGRLLIGAGYLSRYYVHLGFAPAWQFETVHELVFDGGRLVEARDVSGAMAEIREWPDDAVRRPAVTQTLAYEESWPRAGESG